MPMYARSLAFAGGVSLHNVALYLRQSESDYWSSSPVHGDTTEHDVFNTSSAAADFFYHSLMYGYYPALAVGALVGGVLTDLLSAHVVIVVSLLLSGTMVSGLAG